MLLAYPNVCILATKADIFGLALPPLLSLAVIIGFEFVMWPLEFFEEFKIELYVMSPTQSPQ